MKLPRRTPALAEIRAHAQADPTRGDLGDLLEFLAARTQLPAALLIQIVGAFAANGLVVLEPDPTAASGVRVLPSPIYIERESARRQRRRKEAARASVA